VNIRYVPLELAEMTVLTNIFARSVNVVNQCLTYEVRHSYTARRITMCASFTSVATFEAKM